MIEVIIDIEATGRTHKSVFAIAICAQLKLNQRVSKVFYLPEVSESFRSPDTIKWWTSDDDRKTFLENALEKGKNNSRNNVANEVRNFIDELYSHETKDSELVFYSDFPVFDIGLVNTILADANLLPVYLKDDKAYPREVVDSSMYVKGLAKQLPEVYSSVAYKLLNLKREETSSNHDPLVDVDLMMNDIQRILGFVQDDLD